MDLLRYELYCARGGKVDPEALPLCRASLRLHMKRVNYQAAIWRRAVIPHPDVPSPHWHDRKVSSTSKLVECGLKLSLPQKKSLNYCLAHAKEFALLKHECRLKAGLKRTDMCTLQSENLVSDNVLQMEVMTKMLTIDLINHR